MAFKEVIDLNCENTISLGGSNKKTGKANPTKIEGYYLGRRSIEDTKKASGVSYIYIFQTQKGNVGVWGKTDLDRKMLTVQAGNMVRVTQTGMKETKNAPMYVYKVEHDPENTIDVSGLSGDNGNSDDLGTSSGSFGLGEDAYEEETDLGDDSALDEVTPSRAVAPRAAVAVGADRAAQVQALLNGNARKRT